MAKPKNTENNAPLPATEAPQALATTDYGLLTEKPSWIKSDDRRGAENVDVTDLKIPRLAIAQDLSPQLKRTKAEYIEGLELYDLFNNLTGTVYGRGPIAFLPIRMDKRAMEWYPRDSKEGEGIKDRDVPWDDDRCQFHGDEPPVATRYYDFIALLLPTLEPIVISCHDTNFKHGKTLLSLIQFGGGPFWSRVYKVETVIERKDAYEWGAFKFGVVPGYPTDEMALAAENAYEAFKGKALAVDEEADRGGAAQAEPEADAPPTTSAADVV